MKKILIVLLVFPLLVLGQSQDQNYVKTTAYKVPTTTVSTPTTVQKVQNITYYDGLGRPIQQVAHGQSATGKDIVTPMEYDDFGRQVKDYLPYVPTTAASQNYLPTALTDVGTFANYVGQNPYSEKVFEASPLNRVLKQAAPGTDWANGSGHEIKLDYQTNVAGDAVKLFNIVSTWDLAKGLYDIPTTLTATAYADYQLYKTITYDENTTAVPTENNGSTVEFKDKEGRVVLKRTYSIVGIGNVLERHDTYYVYDQYGNLTFVLPPKVDTNQAITNVVLADLCYQYKYDYRNRLVEKKLPGKQWEFIVYDKLDRVIATGPALSPFSNLTGNGWMITKYDVFNRPVLTAWMQSTTVTSAGRKTLQDLRNADTVLSETKTAAATVVTVNTIAFNYTNVAFPAGTTAYHVLSLNYYDNYDTNLVFAPVISFASSTNLPVYYNNTAGTLPKGMPTISWVRVVESTNFSKNEKSYTLYDNKARPIRTFTNNFLGGYTQVDTEMELMTGRVNKTTTTHKRLAASTVLTITDNFTYTDQDRLLRQTQTINTNPAELIAENTYDELGQLISKKVGNLATSITPLQKIDYTYNIRGWLTGINKVVDGANQYPLNQSGDPNDLFAFKINYNTIQNETGYAGKELYNGNISETYWRTAGDNNLRKYGYFYDDLNRLRSAIYQRPGTSVPVTNMYNESMRYDKNGNIMALQRNGDYDAQTLPVQIDNLNYAYDAGNRLQWVQETSNDNGTYGFKDGVYTNANTATVPDYEYDLNGNMIKDRNKNIINNIKYNHLNLPTEIVIGPISPVKKITYLYNALGQKMQKTVTQGTTADVTDYLGGFQYIKQGTAAVALQFFPHAEGYVNFDAGVYKHVYNYTDHLGNNRLSYTKNTTTGLATVMEENHYFPFGLKHTNYNVGHMKLRGAIIEVAPVGTLPKFKYKYNGKELQDELGLNMYDYGARNYMADIGRWGNMDAMSEEYFPISPYTYAINNPMFFVDPDGNYIEIYYGSGSKESEKYGYKKNRDYSIIKGGSDGFLADAYRALDALYEASNIEVDGNQVNLVQELINDKKELSVVEGGQQGGSHFAKGRDFESKGKWTENSKNVIGTIHFNTKEGNLYDDVNNTSGKELKNLYKSNNLSKNTKIVSATSIFGHEIVHAFNYAGKPSDYRNRVNDISTQNNFPYFKNVEEAEATTLSNLININLKQPQRNNYRAIGVPTQGVLSNQVKQ